MNRNKLLCRLINSALLLSLLFCGLDADAQKNNINFNHLTVEDGLSQSSVLSIAQDSMGFMWFGTKDGLNKFNTQRFEVFKHDKNNNASLSSSQNINALLTDRKGNLWVATQKGLNLYLPESNSFKRLLHNPKNKNSISHNIIRNLFEDKEGNIWIGTDNGLNKLVGPDKFQRFYSGRNGQGLAHSLIKAIHQDHNGVLWVATLEGLTSMTKKNGKYVFQSYFHEPNNPASLINNDLSAVFEDAYHNLWIGTHNDGLELMDRANGTFKHYSAKSGQRDGLSSNVIRKIKTDKDGRLWISTLNGIDIFDVKTGKFTVLNHIPNDPLTLNQNSTYDILKDAAGSMWVGTYYGGVNVYHANSTPFREYKTNLGGNGISSNVISSIVEDEHHNLWIGTEAEGLNYYNRTTGVFKTIKNEIGNPNSLSSNLVKAISIDKRGRVWVATYEGNLDMYLPGSGTFKHYKPNSADPHALNSNRIVCLLHDSRGRLWVGTRAQGIFLYNETRDNFTLLSSPLYNQDLKFVRTFYEDADKNIWIATNSGVYIVSANSNQIKRFVSRNSDFKFDDVNFIREDSKGTIWIGSYDSGLIKYDKNKETSRFYTIDDGLPSNNAVGLLEDRKGNLWVSTSNGLSKFDGKLFKSYTVEDGLPGNVFNYNSFFKDSRDEMFFGGYNGLVSFFPDQIRDNKKVPKAIFTRLRLFNKPVNINDKTGLLKQDIGLTRELTFSYHQNIFSVDFAVLNYIKSEKNRYAYQLKGFEKEWNYVANPQATFTNLPAGRYVLLIKGANNDGVWTSKPEELIINVKPPFWKTWWAYLIYVLCISGLIFLILRFLWIRALLRKEHEIYQMKLDFFTNVSHEIRTPLTLIVGPLEHLVDETKESPALNRKLLTVKKNAGRLTRLVNELMDFRKAESGSMELNVAPGNIVSFAKEIYISFTYVALKNHIDYRFNCNEDVIEVYFDSEQLEKVLFNLLSNAFKFTPEHGIVCLDIIKTGDNHVEIRVADNGKGIPEESRNKIFTNFYQVRDHRSGTTGTGIGLALAEKITGLHHGQLSLINNEELKDKDVHTCFCLRLKLGKAHFKKDELIEQYISSENPILYQQVSEIEPAKLYEPTEKTEDGVTVLIVEDNDEVRSFITQSLKQSYHVIEANNGEAGVKMAIEKIPDIIVSDVMMPVMDGLELCRTLKTDARTSHIPIILLTARSGNIHEVNGLKTGAEAYITKPFSINSLQLNIYNLLTLQANMRRKFSQQITLQPTNILIESADEEFLNKIMGLIEANFNNEDFSVNTLATEVGMSTPILYKKIKVLTDLTVNNFIKSVRLKRAAQLLKQDVYTVYEVAYMVGFSDSKYFSKEFAKQFGQTPSEYSLN